MKGKGFLENTCVYGICSCAGLSFLTTQEVSNNDIGHDGVDWRLKFVRGRFSKLVEILNSTVTKETKMRILEDLGRVCSRQNIDEIRKYIGSTEAFLKSIEDSWAEKVSFSKTKKEIKVIGRKTEKQFCPFVEKTKLSKDFCSCSLGWQKETFKIIFGHEVEAKVDSSVLAGADRCSFTIKVA